MSYRITAAVWKRYPRGGSEKLLALALAKYAQDDGTRIFPSVATLAAETVQGERTVQTQLKSMRESGWLIVSARPTGGRKPTEYRIDPAWLRGAEAAPLAVQGSHPSDEARGAEAAPQGCEITSSGVQIQHPRGAEATAPERSLKRSGNVSDRQLPPPSSLSESTSTPSPMPSGFVISDWLRIESWNRRVSTQELELQVEEMKVKARHYKDVKDWEVLALRACRENWAGLDERQCKQAFREEQQRREDLAKQAERAERAKNLAVSRTAAVAE